MAVIYLSFQFSLCDFVRSFVCGRRISSPVGLLLYRELARVGSRALLIFDPMRAMFRARTSHRPSHSSSHLISFDFGPISSGRRVPFPLALVSCCCVECARFSPPLQHRAPHASRCWILGGSRARVCPLESETGDYECVIERILSHKGACASDLLWFADREKKLDNSNEF